MATAALIATIVSAGAAVGSSIYQSKQQKKMAREQQRQNRIQNKLAKAKNARAIRARVAESRVRVAELQQAGFAFGVPGSSSVQQSAGAVGSQTAGAVGFAQFQEGAGDLLAQSRDRVSQIQGQTDPFALVGNIAGAFANPQANAAIGALF